MSRKNKVVFTNSLADAPAMEPVAPAIEGAGDAATEPATAASPEAAVVEKQYVSLSNPETAAQYDSLIEVDQWVHVPALFGEDKCFRGNISTIGPLAARRYVLSGGNLLRKKEASPVQ